MLTLYRILRGIFSLLWVAGSTLLLSLMILVLYLFGLIMPSKIRFKITEFLSKSSYYFANMNKPALQWLGVNRWVNEYPKHLDPNGIYLVIANHQSWSDIIIILFVLNHRAAPLKFFMKKELAWQLPIIGLACKAIGFPMLSRHSKDAIKKNPELKNKDKASTIQACQSVKKHPSSLIIFPEGSRFTEKKKAKQQSPYQHLLKPKAGGVAMTLHGIDDQLKGIIDITIDYGARQSQISLLNFLSGKFPCLKVRIEFFPISESLRGDYEEDKEYRILIQSWLSERWQSKENDLLKRTLHE